MAQRPGRRVSGGVLRDGGGLAGESPAPRRHSATALDAGGRRPFVDVSRARLFFRSWKGRWVAPACVLEYKYISYIVILSNSI